MSFKIVTLTLAAITTWAIVPEDANACHRKRGRHHSRTATVACCPSPCQTVASYQPTYVQPAPVVSSGCCGTSHGATTGYQDAGCQDAYQGTVGEDYPTQYQGGQYQGGQPYSQQPYGNQNYGNQPQGTQSYGNQSYGAQGQAGSQGQMSGQGQVGGQGQVNQQGASGNVNAGSNAGGNAGVDQRNSGGNATGNNAGGNNAGGNQ